MAQRIGKEKAPTDTLPPGRKNIFAELPVRKHGLLPLPLNRVSLLHKGGNLSFMAQRVRKSHRGRSVLRLSHNSPS